MSSSRDYIYDACERLDACIFTGDVLYSDKERGEIKEYIARWNLAIAQHEATMDVRDE